MGTEYTIALYGPNATALDGAAEQASEEVKRIDQLISNYLPDSELSKVNREAYDHPVRRLAGTIRAARALPRAIAGKAKAPLISLWDL